MSSSRSPLRSAVDRLALDLVEAVLGAVRAALENDVVHRAEPPRVAPARARARRPVPPPRRPASPARARVPKAAPEIDEYPDVVILDPEALLQRAPAIVASPPAAPPSAPRATALLQPLQPPKRERAEAPTLAPRAGEQVLKAAGGGLVLRRRRATPTAL